MARITSYPLLMERMVDSDRLMQYRFDPGLQASELAKYGMSAIAHSMDFHHPGERFKGVEEDTHRISLNPYDYRLGIRPLTDVESPLESSNLSTKLALSIVELWIKNRLINPCADFYVGASWDTDEGSRI